jgi:hypothetical protein
MAIDLLSSISMHPVLFDADFALGVRILISASQGHCAHKGGTNCKAHAVLGTVIILASVLDFMFALTFIHCIEQICTHLDTTTRKVCPFTLHP